MPPEVRAATLQRGSRRYAGWLLLALVLGACARSPAVRAPVGVAALVAESGWQRVALEAPPFVLVAWTPATASSEHLTVYLEGDGQAWLSGTRVSDDPTPRDPVGLRLALRHPSDNAVYLARPCQHTTAAERVGCDRAWWTTHRYAPEVVAATDAAVDELRRRAGAETLTLVGYSGGGTLAALVAARRNDVVRLVTIAANLDHGAWTRARALSPLDGSLNAADAWRALARIPQVHFVGENDAVVGAGVVEAYAARFPAGSPLLVEILTGFDHRCCWIEHWPELYARAR